VGSKIQRKETIKDCENGYQAQIHLTRGRMAAEQYDLANAYREFQQACDLAQNICGYELQAELQNVAALIHIAKGEYLQAGWHLDSEAKNLRLAGNYREIPNALQLAAAAYEQAGMWELAADRLCRAARVLYGRGEMKKAWRHVERATVMAESACSEFTKSRLALLAGEILQTLAADGEPTPPSNQVSEMLSSKIRVSKAPQQPGGEMVLHAALGNVSVEQPVFLSERTTQ
jgi:tetratricopeptide (TPR) repeat protein